jgi:hypothetical protein
LITYRPILKVRRGAALAALATGLALPALAASEEAAPGRYSMSPVDGGFVRLDRETGAMTFCTGKEGEWSCKPMQGAETETDKRYWELEGAKRAREAEQKLKEHAEADKGTTPPQSGATEPPAAGDTVPPVPPGNLPIPNEQDVDKLFDYVEGMVKKFKERIDRLEKEAKKEPGTPL